MSRFWDQLPTRARNRHRQGLAALGGGADGGFHWLLKYNSISLDMFGLMFLSQAGSVFFCEESATCCDRFQSADEGPICELCSQPVLRVISRGAKHRVHELVLYMKHFDSFRMQTNTGYLDDWRICATLAATYLEVQFVPLPGWSWTQKGKKLVSICMTLDLNMLGKAHNPLVLNIVFPIKVAICGYSPFSDKPVYVSIVCIEKTVLSPHIKRPKNDWHYKNWGWMLWHQNVYIYIL